MENRDVAGQQSQENMAEAAVESPLPRFFCHNCTSEIRPVLPDYTCPQCEMGFIEEVSTNPPEPSEESDDDAYNSSSQSDESVNSLSDLWNMLSYMRRPDDPTRGVIQFPPVFAPQPGISRPGPSRRIRYRFPNRRSSTSDTDSNRRTEGFLHQLVTTLSENSGVVTNASFPVFLNLHSNPGDYAWGRGGFNAILSQLINQLDGTGPPPLPKDKIDEIPTVTISQEQVDKNLQCTVCMEDFQLEESVRRLNCDHHYHEGCIIPWLELHGTCPICRKLLNENASSQENIFSTSPSGNVADMVELPGMQRRPLNAHSTDSDADGMSRRAASYDPLLPSVYDFTDEFD